MNLDWCPQKISATSEQTVTRAKNKNQHTESYIILHFMRENDLIYLFIGFSTHFGSNIIMGMYHIASQQTQRSTQRWK